MDDVGLRVGDAERLAVVDRLAEHFRAGRLSADELEERTALAHSSVTRGDLLMLERDLPPLDATPVRRPAAAPRPKASCCSAAAWGHGRHLTRHTGGPDALVVFSVVIAALWCVWLFTGAGYPWPIWPMLGWGAPVLIGRLSSHGGASRAPDR